MKMTADTPNSKKIRKIRDMTDTNQSYAGGRIASPTCDAETRVPPSRPPAGLLATLSTAWQGPLTCPSYELYIQTIEDRPLQKPDNYGRVIGGAPHARLAEMGFTEIGLESVPRSKHRFDKVMSMISYDSA